MKKNTIYLIIGLMSVSLLGLISFQLYWINNAIQVNQRQFEQDVNAALKSVSRKIEKQEAALVASRELNTLRKERQITKKIDSIRSYQFSRVDPFIEMKRLDTLFNSIKTPHVVFNWDDENFDFDFNIDIEIESMKDIETRLEHFNENFWTEVHVMQKEFDSIFEEHRTYRSNIEKLANKSEIVTVVLKELITPDKPVEYQLNPDHLDSLLNAELENNGIKTECNYGVLDKRNHEFIIMKDSADQNKLLKSGMMVNLFPNDLFGKLQYLVVDFPNKQQFLLNKIWITLASSAVLILVIIFIFAFAISTIIKQKKLSDIKNDFINNMTHEFKTPISTVALACEALNDQEITTSPATIHRYVGIISDENKRLGQQVEKVLQIATLDKKDFKLKPEKVDLHDIIRKAIDNIALSVNKKGGEIVTQLKADNSLLISDQLHLTNIVNNLLDNANKYSPDAPKITIHTENTALGIKLSISDQGIGMSKESLDKIFDKFYRVPTGNVHDVKGFGLGLTYVKSTLEALGGQIKVRSVLKKGSTFTIHLPMNYEKV